MRVRSILSHLHYAVFAAERIVRDTEQSALMDLYEATVDDHFHATAPPVPIAAVNDPNAWDSQPALNQSGDTLYFVSDRPRNAEQVRGNMHVWRAAKVGGAWTKPVPVVQLWTTGNDVTPSFSPDGYLYFSSDGNPDHKPAPSDLGGRDIFRVRLNGGVPAGEIERLTAPINGPADDDFPSVTTDGGLILLASDRGGGCGGRDIYAFPRPVKLHLRGEITQSIECDSGRVKITPFRTTVILSGPNGFSKNISSDDSGRYVADLGEPGQYSVRLEGLRCSDKNISADISAPRPIGVEATYEKNINVPRVTLRDTLGRGSKIPFFITGIGVRIRRTT